MYSIAKITNTDKYEILVQTKTINTTNWRFIPIFCSSLDIFDYPQSRTRKQKTTTRKLTTFYSNLFSLVDVELYQWSL